MNLPHPPQLDKLILELVELHESRDSTSILQRAADNSMRGSPSGGNHVTLHASSLALGVANNGAGARAPFAHMEDASTQTPPYDSAAVWLLRNLARARSAREIKRCLRAYRLGQGLTRPDGRWTDRDNFLQVARVDYWRAALIFCYARPPAIARIRVLEQPDGYEYWRPLAVRAVALIAAAHRWRLANRPIAVTIMVRPTPDSDALLREAEAASAEYERGRAASESDEEAASREAWIEALDDRAYARHLALIGIWHESRHSTSILHRAANNSMRGSPIAHYLIEPPTPPPASPGVVYAEATPVTAASTTIRHFFHEAPRPSPGVIHLTVAPHQQAQPTSGSITANVHASWLARAMLEDKSPYALRPKGQTVEHLCMDVLDASLDNPSTAKKLDSNWKLWLRYCAHMSTSPWREDVSTLNEYGRQREAILLANFLKWALTKMKGRRGNARAKPDSAQKCLTGVRKRHQQRNITLVSSPLVNATLKRLCRRHLQDFGPMSLIPHRKEPLSHDILQQVLDTPEGTRVGRELLQWKTRKGRALKGLICLLTFTGLRKAELTAMDGMWATRAHVTWLLRGKVYTDPPPNLLRNPVKGDCVIVVPPLSKSDQTGEVWGSNPMYLPFMPDCPLCPFTAIAAIEVEDPVPLASRSKVPLISPCGALPFKGDYLDRLLPKLLSPIVGPSRVSVYSWHSFRIMLACALLAKGASRGMIQSLCRWQSEESLNVYARLNPATYAYWLVRSVHADVSSVSTANLPILSEADTAFELMQELQHAAPSN